jgi:hypothetical protein
VLPKLKILSTSDEDFDSKFKLLLKRDSEDEEQVTSVVREIVESVQLGGAVRSLRF